MNSRRIRRLLRIIGLLQTGSGQNVESLALECRVTRRTIFRDLAVLRESGLDFHYDEDALRYHVPTMYYLPPTNFTAEEALAILVLCNDRRGTANMPFQGPIQSAALKFESRLPAALRLALKHQTRAIELHRQPSRFLEPQSSVYHELIDAAARRHCVRIEYDSVADKKTILTKLSPYRLLHSRHSWYVIGRSSLHRATRTFNIGRILKVQPLEESFRVPRGFSLDRYLRNAWHIIPEPGPNQEVLIRFSPLVARNVAEVRWHKSQRQQLNDDGSLDFRVTVSGLWEISWWIMGYGDQAVVLSPPKLRELIERRIEGMAHQYGQRVTAPQPKRMGPPAPHFRKTRQSRPRSRR